MRKSNFKGKLGFGVSSINRYTFPAIAVEIFSYIYSAVKDFQKANVESMLGIEKKNHEELFAMSNPEEVLRRRFVSSHSF